MSVSKKQKISFNESKMSTTPECSETDCFSECSVGTALDNVHERLDELADELTLVHDEIQILKNLLERFSSLPPFPPQLVRQEHHGGMASSSSALHDAMSTDTDCFVSCCNDNTKC